ncbi:MAG: radical SAM family heme chaperone HemW [Elusimicrobia bacterium]|nr:radical SAM family heme chaperone HemW [Elusimicrobiota bacterium]
MAGLYVHIPFCSGKCAYCDFASFPGRGEGAARYLRALAAEARRRGSFAPETLYVGGGTPTELSAGEIDGLFDVLDRAYPGARPAETTFEANPESVDERKLDVLRRRGVTRLSLGVQALDDEVLRRAGRRHTAARAEAAFRLARREGAWSLSVDLICGLPGQSREGFIDGLRRALAWGPDHLSLYALETHEGSAWARSGLAADEDAQRDMLEAAWALLAAAGLAHYEISNFARPGHESRHNLNYWRAGEYLGLGCAAASHLGGARERNVQDLDEYLRRVEAGEPAGAESERLAGKDKLGERALLGLRQVAGLELDEELAGVFSAQWSELERRGLVRLRGRRAALTHEGLFLANEAFASFVPPYETAS